MAVHFVTRSPYNKPAQKYQRLFEAESLLSWFQKHWSELPQEESDVDQIGLADSFCDIAELELPPPESFDQFKDYVENVLDIPGEVCCSPHSLQILTDDDELQMADYLFDDQFCQEHRDLSAFLLFEPWELPADAGSGTFDAPQKINAITPAGDGEGQVFLALMNCYDSENLYDLAGAYRLDGLRLPEFSRYLSTVTPDRTWPFELRLLRAHLLSGRQPLESEEAKRVEQIGSQPGDHSAWEEYSRWLAQAGRNPAEMTLLERALQQVAKLPPRQILYASDDAESQFGTEDLASAQTQLHEVMDRLGHVPRHDPSQSVVRVDEHIAQVAISDTSAYGDEVHVFHQWFLFDDLWGCAHRDLASGILRFARRWDVLTLDPSD